ncbi:hypothetical protein CJ195_16510 [Bacillus sp. UMB0899]|nr:hypothetical protein CJ195_16510 [Bacillus sp. UMB0899]
MRKILSGFDTSKVRLLKISGKVYNDIAAVVQPNMIFVDDSSIPIEEGDHFIRETSNGLEEKYIVLDRGFFETQMGFDAHYQCKVKKEKTIELSRPHQNVIYNLYGANSRVNNHSTDNSSNIVEMTADDLFDKLRNAIKENIENDTEKRELRTLVNDLESNQDKSSFNQIYTKFITTAANHMTIISPFLPALSQLIK